MEEMVDLIYGCEICTEFKARRSHFVYLLVVCWRSLYMPDFYSWHRAHRSVVHVGDRYVGEEEWGEIKTAVDRPRRFRRFGELKPAGFDYPPRNRKILGRIVDSYVEAHLGETARAQSA